MKKLLSSFKAPCTIKININPSETLENLDIELKQSASSSSAVTQNLVRSRPKNVQHSIHVMDPHDQFATPTTDSSQNEPFYRYHKDDPINGNVIITPSSSTQHQGIRIELIGEICLYFESKQTHRFITLVKELMGAGTITQQTSLPFEFNNVMKEYESYRGINCDLRYYLKCTIIRSVFSIVKEQEFWIQCPTVSPNKQPTDPGIHMEVGLEGIVLLSIKYNEMYHDIGHGVLTGQLRFYLVNVKIDKAEVSLLKKEKTWNGEHQEIVQQDTLKKFEIIDGTPAKDEIVPVRIYFSAVDAWKMTPTIPDEEPVEKKFSVRYFVHLALCDTKGRRYFKSKEIVLWRRNM
jgi:vacuolar protein sorting-associated protein 26